MPKKTKFKNSTLNFIETGSYMGDGIQLAIDSGFKQIFSIEISDKYYYYCRQKFANYQNIHLIQGDSLLELAKLLENKKDPFTFWLDAHYSGADTGFGNLEFPIMKELETILSRNINGETIYIDDMRILRNFSQEINESAMIATLSAYKDKFYISYEDSDHSDKDIMIFEY